MLPFHILKILCKQWSYPHHSILNASASQRFKDEGGGLLAEIAFNNNQQSAGSLSTDTCQVEDFLTQVGLHPCKHGQPNGYFSIPIQHLHWMVYCNSVGTMCCKCANVNSGRCMMMPWFVRLNKYMSFVLCLSNGFQEKL